MRLRRSQLCHSQSRTRSKRRRSQGTPLAARLFAAGLLATAPLVTTLLATAPLATAPLTATATEKVVDVNGRADSSTPLVIPRCGTLARHDDDRR